MRYLVLSLILSLILSTTDVCADKAVKQKSTGRLIYKQSPDFVPGKGIENAKAQGYDPADCEEVNVTQAQWDAEVALRNSEFKNGLAKTTQAARLIKAMLVALKKKNPTLVLPTEDEIKAEIQ